MKQKVIMLTETNGNTALFSGVNSNTPKIGSGAAIYEMLTYVFKDLRARNTSIGFNGVELGFFKDSYSLYDPQTLVSDDLKGLCADELFTHVLVKRFAKNRTDIFSHNWQGTLCTRQAVGAVLNSLAESKSNVKDKTGFVFVSDTPDVFSGTEGFIPTRSQLPDLTIFCLNSEAVTNGSRFLSSFKTDVSEVKILDYASVQDNMAQVISAYLGKYPGADYRTENLVKFCLENRCGVPYAVYDAVKTVFGYSHSYSE